MSVSPVSRFIAPILAVLVAVGVMAFSPPRAEAHDGHGHVLIFTEAPAGPWHDAAIAAGAPKLKAALEAEGIDATIDADSSEFTDEGLAQYDAIVAFQTNGDPWTADEKAAMERWMQAGGGIAAVHNATDMRGNYAWWDQMVGSLMPGHAHTGEDPGQPGVVRVEDQHHPSTQHLGSDRWTRSDEWYNFSNNVRGTAHVLATMDESTYDPGGNAMGYDHPISWCKPYDGGRFWATAQGHFPSHYDEPEFMQHLVGGVKYAAGLEKGDCGGTVWENYERVPLDQNTSAPFAIDVAPDGKVFFTELVRGQIRVFDPEAQTTSTAITIPVYSGGEDGLLGITLANDFATSGHLYVYYSPASDNDSDPANFTSTLSRLTYDHETGTIDRATEQVILEVPARRLPDEPGHTGGGLDIDADGNLYLGVGDDVNPHSEPSGGYAPLSNRTGTFHDARATSANTNDLRGKILRIHPEPDGGYTIPEGNLFPEAEDTDDKTLPEIYAMGFRNPFRFSVDPETGWLSMADYAPDNGTDAPATRGPAGIVEWNLIKSPGNYGWPLCMGNNEPFRDVDYGQTSGSTPVVGAFFDCANPVNDSPKNTGLTDLPPARSADMWYGYQRSSVPQVIPQGGGLAPMGGPIYRYDDELDSDTKFPASFDGKAFFYEWARNKMYSIQVKDDVVSSNPGAAVEKVNPFLPQEQFLAPIDSKFGPDGSMYVLDWGGGFGRDNPNSGLYRVDYIDGSRSPVARIVAAPTSGHAPLEVTFGASESSDPEGADLEYAWDFENDGTVDATGVVASHTYEDEGVHTARLTVTDPDGKEGTTTVEITVGNTSPTVAFDLPPNGSFFDFGDEISWDVEVTDPEDGDINGDDVVIQPALGHDEHAHPTQPLSGFTGSTETSLGGHGEDENIFFAIDARYTDQGGAGGANPLTGSDTTLVFPKIKQAEFFDAKSPSASVAAGRDPAGGGQVVTGKDGAWVRFRPVSFYRIDELALRVSATSAGTLELRRGAPDGELLGTAEVPATGTGYRDVTVDVSDLGSEGMTLYVVFAGPADVKLNFLEAIGQGSSPADAPRVAITAPEEGQKLDPDTDVQIAANASDGDGDVTNVEFFVGQTKIGEDDTAPYEITWRTPAEEGLYHLTAVATDNDGRTKTSRVVVAQVGELYGALQPFTNVGGEFERLGSNAFRITGAGNDTWQGVDQYSSLYHPGGGDEEWEAVVRVDAHTMTHNAAKAGIMVKNDVTLPGTSPGYAMVALRPSGGIEFLTDPDGNGQLNSSVQGGSSGTPKWLKLRRDSTGYSAYWSNTGTTWTQVGEAVTLTGAASTQDVGIFMMSHEAAAKSADFSEFAIDTDPVDPDPEPDQISDPLVCPTGPLSDEFDSSSLLAKWGLRYAPGKPVTQSAGALNLPVTDADINEANTGPVSFAGQPVPAGDWTATTKLTLEHSSHWQWAGIVVHQDDDNYNKLGFVRNSAGNRFVEFQSETNGIRNTPGSSTVTAEFPTTIHLRLVNTGGTLTAAYSADGDTWTDVNGSTPLKPNARIGLMGAGDLGTEPVVAEVDWFRFTPEPESVEIAAADEFDGGQLDGCRWAKSVRYNSHTEEVVDGHLKVTTEPGDINGSNPVSPRNFILQDAPEGDWVATTRFKAPLKHRWQLAGLLMYADDDNYVKADVVASNNPGTALDLRAEASREVNGTISSGSNVNVADSTESGYWYLRVTKTGDQYVPEVSDGGVNWTPIGSGIAFDKPLDALGLMAIGPEQEEPVVVEFDYFHLEAEGEPDTTAPTTELTLAPAQPDGENDWYVTAPTFTLSADDGEGSGVESTEYHLGDGAWTAYTGEPVSLADAADGTVEISYRSTDVAGNEEETGSRTVRIDRTAPETSATHAADGAAVVVTLSPEDPTSDVALTEYRVDEGEWTEYTEPVRVTGAGEHVFSYRSTNRAGLVEETKTLDVTVGEVDTTGPTVVISGVRDGAVYGHSRRPNLRWTVTPTGDAVRSVVARLDGRRVRQGTLDLAKLSLGRHRLVVTATDEGGNATTETVRFRVTTSFGDTKRLVKRFAKAGSMTPAVKKELLAGLKQAQRLAERRPAQAVKHLQEVRRDLGKVRNTRHRMILEGDVTALIRSLR